VHDDGQVRLPPHGWLRLRGDGSLQRPYLPPSPPLHLPDITDTGIGEETLGMARVRARGRGGAYIGEVGRADGGSRLGMRGGHPRR
jgi:hypothetical protein